jgi:hypothetical protein
MGWTTAGVGVSAARGARLAHEHAPIRRITLLAAFIARRRVAPADRRHACQAGDGGQEAAGGTAGGPAQAHGDGPPGQPGRDVERTGLSPLQLRRDHEQTAIAIGDLEFLRRHEAIHRVVNQVCRHIALGDRAFDHERVASAARGVEWAVPNAVGVLRPGRAHHQAV